MLVAGGGSYDTIEADEPLVGLLGTNPSCPHAIDDWAINDATAQGFVICELAKGCGCVSGWAGVDCSIPCCSGHGEHKGIR